LDFILFIYCLLCNKKEQVYTTTTCLKTWAIFGFVKGISSGFDSQQCGKLLNQQVCLVELTKGAKLQHLSWEEL
jgi:hypothetical protein